MDEAESIIETPQVSRRTSVSTDRGSTQTLLPHEPAWQSRFQPGEIDYDAISLSTAIRASLSTPEQAKVDATLRDQLRAKSTLRDVIGRKRSLVNSHEASLTAIEDSLNRGAALQDSAGFSALQCEICASARPGVVELLLSRGADISEQKGEYGNALQAACARPVPNLDIVRLLLAWGADVNAQDWFYGSALQLALYSRSTELIELLISCGARQEEDYEAAIKKNPYMGSRRERRRLVGVLAGHAPQEPDRREASRLDFLTGRPTRR